MNRRAALAALVLPFAVATGSAAALEIGQEATLNTMKGLLQAEGQVQIARGQEESQTDIRGYIYTVDSKGSGYVIKSKNLYNDGEPVVYVYAKLKDVRTNAMSIPANPKDIKLQCDKYATLRGVPQNQCFDHDSAVKNYSAAGYNVLLQATLESPKAGPLNDFVGAKFRKGAPSDWKTITVVYNTTSTNPVRRNTGAILASDTQGVTVIDTTVSGWTPLNKIETVLPSRPTTIALQ